MKSSRKIIELFLDDLPSVIQDYNFTEDDFSKCELEFIFYESSSTRTPFVIDDSTMSIVYQNPNGVWGNDKLEILDSNRALVTLGGWAIDTNGTVKAMVQGYDADGRLSFGDFKFKVKKDFGPLQLEETENYSLLTKLIAEVSTIISDEKQRLSNEITRVANEKLRVESEVYRKNDYESLKKIIIDESQAANLQDQINGLVQINVLDFGIKGNGALEDLTQLNNYLATTPENKTIIFPHNKVYRINKDIIINAKNCNIEIGGTIICENCNGIVLKNTQRCKININNIKKDYSYNSYSDWWSGGKTIPYLTFTNSAILLDNASHNVIRVNFIYGFLKAISLEPTGNNDIPNGCQYNDIYIGQIECCTYGKYFERQYNGAWANSNHFIGGKFSGYTDILMKATSITGDRYNQNVFEKFGCEYVYNGAIDIQEGEENSFDDYRFDQVDGIYIKTSDVTFNNKFNSTYRTNVQACLLSGTNNILNTPSFKNGSIYALSSTNINTKIVNCANTLSENSANYTEAYAYGSDLPMSNYYKVFQDSKGAIRPIASIPNLSNPATGTTYELTYLNMNDLIFVPGGNITYKITISAHMADRAFKYIFITRNFAPTSVTFLDRNGVEILDLRNKFLKPNTIYMITRIDTYEVFEIGHKLGATQGELSVNVTSNTNIIDSYDYNLVTLEQPSTNAIIDINGKANGKSVEIMAFNSNTTLVHNTSKIRLKGNINANILGGGTIKLRCFNNVWWEVYRSF